MHFCGYYYYFEHTIMRVKIYIELLGVLNYFVEKDKKIQILPKVILQT